MRMKLIAASVILVGILCWVGILRMFSPFASANPSTVLQAAAPAARASASARKVLPTVLVVPPIPTPGGPVSAVQLAAAPAPAVAGPAGVPADVATTQVLARIVYGGDSKAINGVPINKIVPMDSATLAHVRQIFAQGQAQGRNPRSFAKIGDSTMAYPPLMADFDYRTYKLGKYADLQNTIDYYGGYFARESAAVKKGMHSWTEFDPAWVNGDQCQPEENPLACEFRLTNPSVAIIRLGANDYLDPKNYNQTMRNIVDYSLARGVIPILGTKPDRQEGSQNTINKIVYQIVADYKIPLWDYDAVAATVPNRGLDTDGIHMLAAHAHDYSAAYTFQNGEPIEDLTALIALNKVLQATGY
jgi:hypothetical protein